MVRTGVTLYTLPETNSSHLKLGRVSPKGSWIGTILCHPFSGAFAVSFREIQGNCILSVLACFALFRWIPDHLLQTSSSNEPGSKLLVLGMVIQPLIGNPYNGYINPYYWVDDHPLLYGNNGSLDPSTNKRNIPKVLPTSKSKKKRWNVPRNLVG